MTRSWGRLALILLLVSPFVIQLCGSGGHSSFFVGAQEDADIIEGEEDADGIVENEETISPDSAESATGDTDTVVKKDEDAAEKEDDEEAEPALKPSPDAETTILFIKPTGQDYPAGYEAKALVGFYNKGDKSFVVETMDAALRYPQDFTFYIQNFTTYRFSQTVEPNKEATFEYSFIPSETLSSRSFGLVINLNYKDSEGLPFQDAVFNSTINIIEPDEGLDGETFFLYVFLAAVVVLMIVGIHQLLSSFRKKRMSSKPKQQVEMGTQNNKSDVDYDWIPKETLQDLNKSPRASPKSKTSPRLRSSKRRTGGTDE